MAAWPFAHNWSVPYRVTYSFLTTVLTSQSGREQRIAQRGEPRRTISTEVLRDDPALDRFVWATQASTFDHVDPATGGVSLVRFAEQQTLTHVTSRVSTMSVALSVEPGTDSPAIAAPVLAFQGRYVFPFPVNWTAGVVDTLLLPRRTVDFGSGRIAVTRPVAFATRSAQVLLLRVGAPEIETLVDFFAAMSGRQGEFWCVSQADDLIVLETVSTAMRVSGEDVAAMYAADTVNSGVEVRTSTGRLYRRVVNAVPDNGTTVLTLGQALPSPALSASWMRVSRFASDDLTVEWTTATVAQSQVQVQTLPYAAAEGGVETDEMQEYYGTSLDRSFSLRDYTVNVQIPNLSGSPGNTDIERPRA